MDSKRETHTNMDRKRRTDGHKVRHTHRWTERETQMVRNGQGHIKTESERHTDGQRVRKKQTNRE